MWDLKKVLRVWDPKKALRVWDLKKVLRVWDPKKALRVWDLKKALRVWDPKKALRLWDLKKALRVWDLKKALRVWDLKKALRVWDLSPPPTSPTHKNISPYAAEFSYIGPSWVAFYTLNKQTSCSELSPWERDKRAREPEREEIGGFIQTEKISLFSSTKKEYPGVLVASRNISLTSFSSVSLYHGEYDDQLLWLAGWFASLLACSLPNFRWSWHDFFRHPIGYLLELQQNSDLFLISIFTMAAACFFFKKNFKYRIKIDDLHW